jgi:hypothetical protein
VVEDLGPLSSGLAYLKGLISEGNQSVANDFEDVVIETTVAIIRARMLDVDNNLNNFGVTRGGTVYRLDIECARRWRGFRPPRDLYGAMIGRLVYSHAFACQPALERTQIFATKLAERLDAPKSVLERAYEEIKMGLALQKHEIGVDSRLELPW